MSQAPQSGPATTGQGLAIIGVILVAGLGLVVGLPMLSPQASKEVVHVPVTASPPTLKVPPDTGKDLFDAFEAGPPENVLVDPTDVALPNGYSIQPVAGQAGKLALLHNGKEVYTRGGGDHGERISIVSPIVAGESEPITGQLPLSRDITGDGVPDLILLDYTGGAHCCHQYSILSLGKTFKKIADIDGKDSQVLFKDINGDGVFELALADATFAYWNTAFSESPLPKVVLQFQDGKYALARGLMSAPPPLPAMLAARLKAVRSEMRPSADNPAALTIAPALWNFMLDLIYSGNGDLAWKVFDQAWPDGAQGWCPDSGEITKEEFLSNFRKQLAESPYWLGIKELNHWSPMGDAGRLPRS